jgi:hypothetical protein
MQSLSNTKFIREKHHTPTNTMASKRSIDMGKQGKNWIMDAEAIA